MSEALEESVKAISATAAGDEGAASLAVFPAEPFACPSCGQLLGPACRVCVACKEPIDPARIKAQPPVNVAAPSEFKPPPRTVVPSVPFPWGLFFLVLGFTWLAAGATLHFLGPKEFQIVFGLAQLLLSAWIFYDARERRIPKPWRWAISALVVWVVIFPWYLARRRTRDAACPFMEAETSPFFRTLVVFLLLALGLVLVYRNVPLPK